jgi:16S rRNA C967 or C1407 C5-methylase (RsmB/RsmF family)
MCGLNLEFIPYKGQAMTEQQMPSDEAIMRSLNANPQIKSRIAALLAVVEDAADDLKEADAAEIRRMGQEAMQAWANRQNEITEQEVRQVGQVHREGKKNSAGTPPLATSV